MPSVWGEIREQQWIEEAYWRKHNEIIVQITKNREENEEKEFDDDSMTTLSDSDQNENEDSEDDEAFLARFDKNEECIG